MDCVLHAFWEHLIWLGAPSKHRELDLIVFRSVKATFQGNAHTFTHHALTPFVVRRLSEMHGLEMFVQQARFFTEFMEGLPEVKGLLRLAWRSEKGYEVERFALPGIICDYGTMHASFGFSATKTTGLVIYLKKGKTLWHHW